MPRRKAGLMVQIVRWLQAAGCSRLPVAKNLHHVVAVNAYPGLFGGAARGATWQHQDVHVHAGGGRHAGGLQGWRKAENGILSAPCPLQAGDPGYKRVIWA